MRNDTVTLTGVRPGTQITITIPDAERVVASDNCIEVDVVKAATKSDSQRLSDDELFAVHRMLRSCEFNEAKRDVNRETFKSLRYLLNRLDEEYPDNAKRAFELYKSGNKIRVDLSDASCS